MNNKQILVLMFGIIILAVLLIFPIQNEWGKRKGVTTAEAFGPETGPRYNWRVTIVLASCVIIFTALGIYMLKN